MFFLAVLMIIKCDPPAQNHNLGQILESEILREKTTLQ
jgi:hypothetical protein